MLSPLSYWGGKNRMNTGVLADFPDPSKTVEQLTCERKSNRLVGDKYSGPGRGCLGQIKSLFSTRPSMLA
jgi:hypothetical protein